MIFHKTPLDGAMVIESELLADERGHFARTFCGDEFAAQGIEPRLAQISISFNRQRGTLRGLHFQSAPYQEAKTVRCIQGRVFDVVVDLRRDSRTFCQWFGVELSAGGNVAMHAPAGFAHGFITLEDNSTLEYQISEKYIATAARGIRHDDPHLGIEWPIAVTTVSARDMELPLLADVFGRDASTF